jgi:hypothetical protein
VTLVPVIPRRNKKIYSLRRSIVLSFRATETIFIGTRTQDSFLGVVASVTAIFSLKQTTLVLTPFFYRV